MNVQARGTSTRSLVLHALGILALGVGLLATSLTQQYGVAILFGFALTATAITDAQDVILGELRGENRRPLPKRPSRPAVAPESKRYCTSCGTSEDCHDPGGSRYGSCVFRPGGGSE